MSPWSTPKAVLVALIAGMVLGMLLKAHSYWQISRQSDAIEQDRYDPSLLNPDDSPRDVVLRQLESLRKTSESYDNLVVCYSLASHSNRAVTGPFWRFQQLVSRPPFAGMIGHRSALVGRETIIEDQGWVTVTLITESGDAHAYEFVLRNVQMDDSVAADEGPVGMQNAHRDPSHPRFWMTEAVLPIAIAD